MLVLCPLFVFLFIFLFVSLSVRAVGDKWAGPAVRPYLGAVGEHGLAEAGGRGMHPPVGGAFDRAEG